MGLSDLGPLSSMGACINLKKLNLSLRGDELRPMKISTIDALSCFGQLTSLVNLQTLGLYRKTYAGHLLRNIQPSQEVRVLCYAATARQ